MTWPSGGLRASERRAFAALNAAAPSVATAAPAPAPHFHKAGPCCEGSGWTGLDLLALDLVMKITRGFGPGGSNPVNRANVLQRTKVAPRRERFQLPEALSQA